MKILESARGASRISGRSANRFTRCLVLRRALLPGEIASATRLTNGNGWVTGKRTSRGSLEGYYVGPYFVPMITVAVVGFLGLLAWAARRGKPRADPETGTLVFRHSILFRGFSLLAAFGIPLGITALVLVNPPKKEGDVTAIVCLYALFGALSAPLLWESMRFSLTVSPEGLDCCSPWRAGRFVAWDEVQNLTYGGGSAGVATP